MKVIIGASRNNKLGSKLLCWWMKSNYSHVYAKWYISKQDRDIVYQASHGMVHFIEFGNFIKKNKIVKEFEISLSDDQFKAFSAKCIDLAGEKYSKTELLQIFLMDVTNGKIKTKDSCGYICSELIGKLLSEIGIPFEKPLYLLRPDDIILGLELILPAR